ncbi:hypothetical protein CAPTEDRAFT_213610 [Capitella teleta]|uniref:Sulfatase N-terminal domain-containing protein n=2 Tax=Capitella teleta TaxID=283909 RepID=R7VJ76_CAPTE|nr:hypothetical protein CAPTEDRAFT_213610 [Capitella teleta]|eukprot:ELU16391.1 hypothetical protein CAPTEDRAFT_213610 [Capitella teleta]
MENMLARLFSALCLCAGIHASEKPNIVIFLVDDLGIGDIGAFGNDTLRTPHVDSICENGVKLDHDLAAASLCTPSRTALMTSRYAIRSGMTSVIISLMSPQGIPASEHTLPQMLQEQGYATALIGKWHLGWNRQLFDQYYNPLKRGFDYYFGLPYTLIKDFGGSSEIMVDFGFVGKLYKVLGICLITSMVVSRLINNKLGITMALMTLIVMGNYIFTLKTFGIWNSALVRNDRIVEMPLNLTSITQRLIGEGQNFIKSQHAAEKPIFLFMSWLHVHSYVHPQPPFKGASQHGPYGDAVEETDWAVGQIMDTLRELQMLDNTLFYFSSDHGGDKLEHDEEGRLVGGWNGLFRGSKGDGSHEGGIRVPTCVQWSAKLPRRKLVSEPTSQMDLMPTLASIVGGRMSTDRSIDGKDILPLLTGEATRTPHDFLFHYTRNKISAIRYMPEENGTVYKLHYLWPQWQPGTDTWASLGDQVFAIYIPLSKPLLFDVAKDPREEKPLDTSIEPYSSVVKSIEEAKRSHEKSLTDAPRGYVPNLHEYTNPLRSTFVEYAWQMVTDAMK